MGSRCVKFGVIYLILVTGIHIQKLCLGNRRMNVASIAAAVEAVGGHPVSAQTIRRTLHQIGLHGCRPRKKPLLKIMHKKAINRI